MTPLPATSLLTSSSQDVTGFFGMATANITSVDAALAIAGDPRLAREQIGDETVERLRTVGRNAATG